MADGEADPKGINPKKALKWLNGVLQHMKMELKRVDKFFEDNKMNPEKIHISQEKVNHMHESYEAIEKSVKKYEHSKDAADLNTACSITEMLEPSFELNYGEIIGNANAAGLQFPKEA